ncbi:aldo/keto reductase [Candidatus Neomarinimicrobiota bacterium]
MNKKDDRYPMERVKFIKLLAAASVSGTALLSAAGFKTKAQTKPDELIHRNEQPTMTYRKLGRTNFMSSRLVFGCGAALAGGKAVRLLDRTFEMGINHYDVGYDDYYKGSERSLAPFMKAHREKIWVASKAPLSVRIKPEESITLEQAKITAKNWTKQLNSSLINLQTEYVDAYYLMAVDNPSLINSEEIYKAFLDAKAAGKVGHWGLSTHKNAKKILETAIETGWYDLAMIGITPAGWYDWTTKDLAEGTPPLVDLQPLLDQARNAGIGLIGMKAVRHLAVEGDPSAFDKVYDDNFKTAPLNPFQRAYAYVLEHGLDVVNADMQNFKHLEENIIAAATSHTYFG